MPFVEAPLHEAELPSRGLVGDGEGVAADLHIVLASADRHPAGIGLGGDAMVVDAQTVERRPDGEAIGLGPRPLRLVGPVDANIEATRESRRPACRFGPGNVEPVGRRENAERS